MAAMAFLALLVQSILQFPQMVGYELDEVTRERMQQREEYLTQQMNRLLQELEQKSQEQSSFAKSPPRFPVLHQWQLWVIAVILVLVLRFWWWLRNRIQQPASSSDYEDNSGTKDKPERRQSLVVDVRKASVTPLMGLSDSFPVVEELVYELLCICRKHCSNSFMPLLQPAIGMGSTSESWGPHEHHAVYRMLVPLKPPRGHAFHLELGTGEMLANNYCIRVELECTCTREQLEENMLCFLHHPKEELRRNQGPSLLGTLCTGPYLDREKTNRWFQILVKGASVFLPQSRYWRIIVLPSTCSCKIRLTDASGNTILIEMVLGVQRGYTFLSIE
ncbi:inositol -trisphosphate receptor-interacting 1 [Limosa lapponica baueri]|uniref:Inositol-trisphosphate receptor-interacting 1 n=1 Tax=Limosa lapponica baueri TaxID=1758121 RepID=A0A2I0UFD2_LIMLA|nr:inositol -trisphosphate receptor-interacting 1 [Limosa lapponica baueri]